MNQEIISRYEVRLKALRGLVAEKYGLPIDFSVSSEQQSVLEQLYLLAALGDVLADKRQWTLRGVDAIDLEIIRTYPWPLETVQALFPRDKWLAIHDELNHLDIRLEAIEAWRQVESAAVPIDTVQEQLGVWGFETLGFAPPQCLGDVAHERPME